MGKAEADEKGREGEKMEEMGREIKIMIRV